MSQHRLGLLRPYDDSTSRDGGLLPRSASTDLREACRKKVADGRLRKRFCLVFREPIRGTYDDPERFPKSKIVGRDLAKKTHPDFVACQTGARGHGH
jgi:hypothetical protein